MNSDKMVGAFGGVMVRRFQAREINKGDFIWLLREVDRKLTEGRARVDFVETENYVYVRKAIFRREVESPYEVMYWELKKALKHIVDQEGVITNLNFIIRQRQVALELVVEIIRNQNTLLAFGRAEIANRDEMLVEKESEAMVLKSSNKVIRGELMRKNYELEQTKQRLGKMEDELVNVREALDEEKRSRKAEKEKFEEEIARLKAELGRVNGVS